ncbi:MAG: hypothetical protein ACYCQL_03015, partial [Acidithiobacillus sp.]
ASQVKEPPCMATREIVTAGMADGVILATAWPQSSLTFMPSPLVRRSVTPPPQIADSNSAWASTVLRRLRRWIR